jgi:hypothetical protein
MFDIRLPDLRIVPLSKLVPHEMSDEQRAAPLAVRLREEGILKNPPVVAPLGIDDEFVILDGANRVAALEAIGIPHVLVQVVDYESPQVDLHTWYHVISGTEADQVLGNLARLPEINVATTNIFHARAALARRDILAFYIQTDGQVTTLASRARELEKRTQMLRMIVDSYIRTGHLNRVNTDNIDRLRNMFPDMAAAIIFPRYEPVEILELARSGLKVPAGITRHIIHGRALRLNYPLQRLTAPISLQAKNQELADWIQEKFNQKGVRFYAEETFLFDE